MNTGVRGWLADKLPAWIFVALLLSIWQWVVAQQWVASYLLPSPLQIFHTTLELWPEIFAATLSTAQSISWGLGIEHTDRCYAGAVVLCHSNCSSRHTAFLYFLSNRADNLDRAFTGNLVRLWPTDSQGIGFYRLVVSNSGQYVDWTSGDRSPIERAI